MGRQTRNRINPQVYQMVKILCARSTMVLRRNNASRKTLAEQAFVGRFNRTFSRQNIARD